MNNVIKMTPVLDVTDTDGDLRLELSRMGEDFPDVGQQSFISINTVADEDVFEPYPLTKAYIEDSGYAGVDIVILFWW